MQASEVIWEYCKDIKKDYIDSAEGFWQQQRPPIAEEVESVSEQPHPNVREFKKIIISPLFGVSEVKRPVADIGKHLSAEVVAD